MVMEEPKYCPFCGTLVTSDDKFCGSCGATLVEEEKPVKILTSLSSTQQPVTQQPITHAPPRIYVPPPKPVDTTRLVLGIIGIVLGVVSLIGFPSLFFTFYFFFIALIIFPILTIVGIVFSSLGLRANTAIGAVGLVLNILALLVEIGFGIFILIFISAWYYWW
ncbi:MAG: hypothetical protein FK733_07145 [Asgard group archaeon]|nr:hypothetical protein [Asgard group archaeon]